MKQTISPTRISDYKERVDTNAKIFVLVFGLLIAVIILLVWRVQHHILATNNNLGLSGAEKIEFILLAVLAVGFTIGSVLYLISVLNTQKLLNLERLSAQNSKDELLSLASHQLRTPTTAVKQYLGMIIEGYIGTLSKEQLRIIKRAYTSNERQIETIDQILYITKANAGRLELQKSYFNLNQIIEESISDLNSVIRERHQKVTFKPAYVNLPIYADRHCVRLVVENLLSNASKYSYSGGRITICTNRKDNTAILSVTDTGVGISSDDKNKLFKKFSRLDNELSVQAGGSGLGLYLGKTLVEMHGGRIRVASEMKKGSTFTVQLPSSPSGYKLSNTVVI